MVNKFDIALGKKKSTIKYSSRGTKIPTALKNIFKFKDIHIATFQYVLIENLSFDFYNMF